MQIAALASVLVLACSTGSVAETNAFNDAWSRTVAQFSADMALNRYVGGSLYFVHDGSVLGQHHYGNQTVDPAHPVDERTIYHWASITKTFTAIGIMQLRDRNLLSLDDSITKYIPALHAVHNPYGSMDEVTIRHLITHTSGFRGPTFPWGGDEDWHPHEPTDWSQWDAMLPYTKLEFAPGSAYSYSNPGTSLLGRIIEIITGDDIEVYIDKNILRPLGMYNSYFDITPWHLKEFRSDNFFIDGDSVRSNGIDFDTGMTTGNGGLNGPVGDMIKFANFLLGTGDERDGEVLKRATLDEMWEPHHTHEEFDELSEFMALTFFVIDHRSDAGTIRYVGHTGGQKAFQAFFYIHPPSRSAAIMAVNSRTVSMERDLYNDTRLTLFREVFPTVIGNR